jgi:ABC-type transporter Mla subunit MlaD
MDDKLTLFIAITAAAVVLQMLILLAMYLAVRKLGTRIEALAGKVEETTGTLVPKVLPLLEEVAAMQKEVKAFAESARPKVNVILDNLSNITTTTRGSVDRIDATVNDAVDRIRLQVIRGDEMLTRTMDRVEETTEKVQHTVMSPVRQVSGIAQAISAGIGTFFHNQKRRRNGGPSDEMFI